MGKRYTFGKAYRDENQNIVIQSYVSEKFKNFKGAANPQANNPQGRRTFALEFNLNDEESANIVAELEADGYTFWTSKYDAEPIKYLEVEVSYARSTPEMWYVDYTTLAKTFIPEENCHTLDSGYIDGWIITANEHIKRDFYTKDVIYNENGVPKKKLYLGRLLAFVEPDPLAGLYNTNSGLGSNMGPSDDGSLPFEL